VEGRRRVTGYAVAWTGLAAGFVVGLWLLLTRLPAEQLRPGELEPLTRVPNERSGPTIDDELSATDLTLGDAELTVSSSDGKLRMRVLIHTGRKERGLYTIEEGALQFSLGDKETLLLRLNNATYQREAGVARVRGTLVGYIAEGGQYFKAEELAWDRSSSSVTTEEVRYVGPSLEVTGERMRVNLETGVVKFEGPVEVGI
jgi:hypothetical protein